ncbi:MAG TPA: class I SAM-dependent methyltransferase [Flavobacterium sp.]|jgi:2-polyprenyl-3-methyl-5-hydroxy-6-metoxy-1,4-benzoquinol methylase
MSYQQLKPLMKKVGCRASAEEFQDRVNVVFHDFEAAHYDVHHSDMWDSLKDQIDLLVADVLTFFGYVPSRLQLLDIGCGTGLSTQLLLQSKLGPEIVHISLLDSSPNMLKQAELKATKWNKPYKLINGYLSSVTDTFDVVIISSVLHHIPDLKIFLQQVDSVIRAGGILIHLQDPNGDYLADPDYVMRKQEYDLHKENRKGSSAKSLIPKPILRYINRLLNRKDYIDRINDQLLKEGTITKRMSADEIWSVTDIHVETPSETKNKGISIKFLTEQLVNFDLVSLRSYAFYGDLKSSLPEPYREREQGYINTAQINGRNIAGVWVKKS